MKKIVVVIFTLLYIGVSSGITLNLHHCMNKLVDIALWDDSTCNSCGEKQQSHDCCSNKTQLVKIAVDQNVNQVQTLKYIPAAIALLFDIRDLYLLSESEQPIAFNFLYNSPPECSGLDLHIQNCTFLI